MKRIITSLGMIVFVGAVVAGATGAFFSDTETSLGNTFTAGSVTLTISDIDHVYNGEPTNAPVWNDNELTFSLTDLKPLDEGDVTYTLANGANEAHICVLIDDSTVAPDPEDTALAGMMTFLFGTNAGTVASVAGVWQTLDTLDANTSEDYSVDYCFGTYDGTTCVLDENVEYNDAQNGTMSVDLEFYAVQTRNNVNFDCDDLNPPAVGANLTTYAAPEQGTCDVTVASNGSINDAIAGAASGNTVCVNDGTYADTVVINKPITILSLTGPLNTAVLENGVHIQSSGVTVSGFEVNTGSITGEEAAFYLANGVDDVEISSNLVLMLYLVGAW